MVVTYCGCNQFTKFALVEFRVSNQLNCPLLSHISLYHFCSSISHLLQACNLNFHFHGPLQDFQNSRFPHPRKLALLPDLSNFGTSLGRSRSLRQACRDDPKSRYHLTLWRFRVASEPINRPRAPARRFEELHGSMQTRNPQRSYNPLKESDKPTNRQYGTTKYCSIFCRAPSSIITSKGIATITESSWKENKIPSK